MIQYIGRSDKKMKKILLISGHGAGDPGAIGNGYKESDLTTEVVNKLAPLLTSYTDVTVYPVERNAFKDIQQGQLQVNFANYDYVLEIHFNAFNGTATGTEIFVTSKETKTTVETAILKSLGTFYRNRGVKVQDFLVINTAKNRGVSSALLEVCFIDNKSDVDIYQANKDGICKSIADAIIKGFGLSVNKPLDPIPTPQPTPTGKTIDQLAQEVIAGQWGVNPERQQQLTLAGYDATAVQARVNQILNQSTPQPSAQYYPAFNSTSIIDGLKSINVDSSFDSRKKIAIANGITNYTGTSAQNTQLLNLARQGKLIRA
jgi:N-acetylmuramoyl-L-alanine amidase